MISKQPTDQTKILAIIPARGGSKGVPRKNLRPIAGRPMIEYTIEVAREVSHLFHRVIVSTDDQEIASIARAAGADVPFMRPDDLASDKSPTLPVMQHAVDFVEQQDDINIDWVCLLRPTSPLRNADDIEGAVDVALNGETDSVISVVQVHAVHPVLMKRIEDGRLLPFSVEEPEGTRRQDLKPDAYMRNGSIYVTRRDVLMNDNSIWGQSIQPYVMPEDRSVGVDSEMDLKLATLLIEERIANA